MQALTEVVLVSMAMIGESFGDNLVQNLFIINGI